MQTPGLAAPAGCAEGGDDDCGQHGGLTRIEQGTDGAAQTTFRERLERLGADVLDRQAEDHGGDEELGFAQDDRGAEDGDLGGK